MDICYTAIINTIRKEVFMKKFKFIILCTITGLMLCSCKSKNDTNIEDKSDTLVSENENIEDKSEYIIDTQNTYMDLANSVVILGEYKHVLDITEDDLIASEDEINEEINAYLDSFVYSEAKHLDGIIQAEDTVNVDYDITIDGETESVTNKDIYITYNMVAPDVDDMLIGKEVGFSGSLEIAYPSNYFDVNVAGKDAVVDITVNYIVEKFTYDTITDEAVVELTEGECSTVDELRSLIKEYIEYSKKFTCSYNLFTLVSNNATIDGDVSELIEEEYQNSLKDFYSYSEIYEIDIEIMYSMYGLDSEEALTEYLYNISEAYIKEKLLVYKLASEFEIVITEEDYNEYVDELKEYYSNDELDSLLSDDYVCYSILYDKVIDKLIEFQL